MQTFPQENFGSRRKSSLHWGNFLVLHKVSCKRLQMLHINYDFMGKYFGTWQEIYLGTKKTVILETLVDRTSNIGRSW